MDQDEMQPFQLNNEGECCTCENIALELEIVNCTLCKSNFHAVCTANSNDNKWATKSMVITFKAPSTKLNFKFFCNSCLTIFETNLADGEALRMKKLEDSLMDIKQDLNEIKETMAVKPVTLPDATNKPIDNSKNVWFDQKRMASIKELPSEPVLVISKAIDDQAEKLNMDAIEKVVIEHQKCVKKSFKNKNGNLVMVCNSEDMREKMKTEITGIVDDAQIRIPKERNVAVSIVGLSRLYEKQEIAEMLVKQNCFVQEFAKSHDIDKHINVFMIKPTRANPSVFQAFVRVSLLIRQGIRNSGDKLLMGLTTCKVYDQFHVKRCNNCQAFGHYHKNCPTPEVKICGQCSQNHQTNDCQSNNLICTNCVKANISQEECNHASSDLNCPTLQKAQEKLRKTTSMFALN